MQDPVQRSAEWVYKGVWLILSDCFVVPKNPPSLPSNPGDFYRTFHPSDQYLSYLKLYFWIVTIAIDVAILAGWIALLFFVPQLALWLAAPVLLAAVLPDIVAYVAIHLKYDTMWYVMTDRSLRLRRGIWVIIEHTITFENVQNVYVTRGPIQQLFGFATIVVETAGAIISDGENVHAVGNQAIMEGIHNADEIRDLIMERVRNSRTAGLGDDAGVNSGNTWTAVQKSVLREIRDEILK